MFTGSRLTGPHDTLVWRPISVDEVAAEIALNRRGFYAVFDDCNDFVSLVSRANSILLRICSSVQCVVSFSPSAESNSRLLPAEL